VIPGVKNQFRILVINHLDSNVLHPQSLRCSDSIGTVEHDEALLARNRGHDRWILQHTIAAQTLQQWLTALRVVLLVQQQVGHRDDTQVRHFGLALRLDHAVCLRQ